MQTSGRLIAITAAAAAMVIPFLRFRLVSIAFTNNRTH